MARSICNDLEAILANLARSFASEGRTTEVAILATSQPQIEESSYDNWNGGTYGYTITLEVPPHLFAQIRQNVESLEDEFLVRAKLLARVYQNEGLDRFYLSTELTAPDGWRGRAADWVTGAGISNQGRVRSTNLASRECDGLLFRSQPEIHLYRALKASGVTFAPLPVFLRGGITYRRIEPDFVIFKDGIVLHVEVDGDTVHVESPVEAHDRAGLMTEEGAILERVRASECDDADKAKCVVQRLLSLISKHKVNRS